MINTETPFAKDICPALNQFVMVPLDVVKNAFIDGNTDCVWSHGDLGEVPEFPLVSVEKIEFSYLGLQLFTFVVLDVTKFAGHVQDDGKEAVTGVEWTERFVGEQDGMVRCFYEAPRR